MSTLSIHKAFQAQARSRLSKTGVPVREILRNRDRGRSASDIAVRLMIPVSIVEETLALNPPGAFAVVRPAVARNKPAPTVRTEAYIAHSTERLASLA